MPFDDGVPKTLPIGWENAFISSTTSELQGVYLEACHRAPGSPMEYWKQGERQDVHNLLKAPHNPLSPRANIFLSKKVLLYIQNSAQLRATALELKDLGIMFASTVQEAWTVPPIQVQGVWAADYFGNVLHDFVVMVTQSWKTLLDTSPTLRSKGSV